jgi:hypothetical protein
MGLFGPSKIKITPHAFVQTQLDKIFSQTFIEAEQKNFARLSKEIIFLQKVNVDDYLRELQNVTYNLFQIAWDRTIPHDIFIEYGLIMFNDPSVKAVNNGAYDMALSKAQEAGLDTFGYISAVFLTLLSPNEDAGVENMKLMKFYKESFTSSYIGFEALIKQHKFIK